MCFFTGPGKAVITKRQSAGPYIWIKLCCPSGYLTVTMKHRPLWFPHHTPKLPWWVLCDGEVLATSLSYLIHLITIQLWPFLGAHNSFFLNKLLNLSSLNFFTCFTISTLILQVSPELHPRSLSHPGGYWMDDTTWATLCYLIAFILQILNNNLSRAHISFHSRFLYLFNFN
jgi:hypothetical protein